MIEEVNAGGAVLARYTNGLGIDETLAGISGGGVTYYEADGLGSTTSLTDSLGAVVATYEYDSFGNPLRGTESSRASTSVRYTGRQFDSETGLYYYRARYYDPTIGRFISEDPIGFEGGEPNLYGYVRDNPVNNTDPLGLLALSDFSDAIAGAGDSLTFGLTGVVRDAIADSMGLSKTSRCSTAYKFGEYTEIGIEITLTLGSAGLRHLAANASRTAVRAAAEGTVGALREQGKVVHHINPLFGHPGGTSALFPTGGLPAALHSSNLNLAVLDAAEHLGAHRALRQAELAAKIIVNPLATGARAVLDASRGCACK